jgi:outer membrane protein assembly factor BamB
MLAGCGGMLEGTEGSREEDLASAPRPELSARRREASPPGTLLWAQTPTGPERDRAADTALDADGNALLLANFPGTIDFGSGYSIAREGVESMIAVAKYRADGTLLWVRFFGAETSGSTLPSASAFSLAVDRERNIVLAGTHNGTIHFGGRRLDSGAFIVKLDGDGRHLWSLPIRGGGLFAPRAIVTDRDDNIAVAGFFDGALNFGHGVRISRQSGTPFLVKLTPEGRARWALVPPRDGDGSGLAVDSENRLYFCGTTSLSFGPEPFLHKVSPDGQVLWSRRLAGSMGFGNGVAVHGNRVVFVGSFTQSFTFRGHEVRASSDGDAFLVAYTREGEERWARNFGWGGLDVAMDQRDGVVVTGIYNDGDDLGLGPLPGVGGPWPDNLFVLKVNRIDGTSLWSQGFALGVAESVRVSETKEGESVVTGTFKNPTDFGSGTRYPQGYGDLFLLRFAP